jgi:hypothetical protein
MRTRPRDRNMQAQFHDLQVGGAGWGVVMKGEGRVGWGPLHKFIAFQI